MGLNFIRQKVDPFRIPDSHRVKWSGPLLSEGFVPFPKKLVRCLGRVLQGPEAINELAVLLAVTDYKRPSVSRPPSVEYLAFVAGLSAEETTAILSRLEAKKLIRVQVQPLGLEIDTSGFVAAIDQATFEEGSDDEIPGTH